jgi:hypothetical protein
MCSRQNISGLYWRLIKHVSQQGTNACTSAYKKSVSKFRSWEVTACITSASVTNRLPTTRFLRGLNKLKSFRPHIANQSCDWFLRYGCELLDHPPYSSHLVYADSHLFGPLQKDICGKRFATAADVNQAVTVWLEMLATLHRFLEQDISFGATVGQMF